MQDHPTTKCLNCGTSFQGKYCYECGQKASVQKLTWKSILEEVVHFFTHAEHSFIYTSKQLVKAPGIIVKEFLDGKRKKVHKPITFLLIWAAILKLITEFYRYCALHFDLYRFKRSEPVFRILWSGPKNPNLIKMENLIDLLIEAPVLVIIGWVVFRKTKNSFVENWVAIIYAISFTFIAALVMNTAVFLLRLIHAPFPSGTINDLYLLGYLLCGVWVIYHFEKVYQTQSSKLSRLLIACILSVFACYASDLVWYGLYRLFPPHT